MNTAPLGTGNIFSSSHSFLSSVMQEQDVAVLLNKKGSHFSGCLFINK
jgi:hypothetical protein